MEIGDTWQDRKQVSKATDDETASILVEVEGALAPGRKHSQMVKTMVGALDI